MTEVLRYTAFSADPRGGNPAGLVLDARGMDERAMRDIAAEVGYSETAFLVPGQAERSYVVRYFSPRIEVAFCGHATIAAGVALTERYGAGRFELTTPVGGVPVDTALDDGGVVATLESVPARSVAAEPDDVRRLLAALRWSNEDLDPAWPAHVAWAGNHHPVLVVRRRERLAALDYGFDELRDLMEERAWTTVQLVWPEPGGEFHVRDPAPAAGIVEDPATGSAAAAFGAYLRETGRVRPGHQVVLHQGEDLGRPSRLEVEVGAQRVRVSGRAVPIPA